MRLTLGAAICAAFLVACGDVKETPLPRELAQMESIKPKLEKLTAEERELMAGYVVRNTVGAKLGSMFGGKESAGIPEGMTIGKAIDEQRKFKADLALEEARQKELKAKLQAERDAAMAAMRDAVTVTLISKRIAVERGYSGIVTGEDLRMNLGYKNNTDKDIAAVKGRVVMKDLFGDEVTVFQISNDDTIKAGQTASWVGGRSVKYGQHEDKDRKFAAMDDDKFTLSWEPQVIVFKDGSKLELPKDL